MRIEHAQKQWLKLSTLEFIIEGISHVHMNNLSPPLHLISSLSTP
jgi:hypothetical protein